MIYLPKIAPLILKLLFLSPYVAKDIGVITENSHRVGGIISEKKKTKKILTNLPKIILLIYKLKK